MIKSALEYHRTTCYHRYEMQPHSLDWNNTPRTYKIYPELPKLVLESTGACPQKSLWDLLEFKAKTGGRSEFNIGTLSDVLLLSYTLTAKRQMGSQTMYYRSVPSAGALYPTELYVCSHHIQDLAPGVYYYDIHGYSLKQLRSGDSMPFQDPGQMVSPGVTCWARVALGVSVSPCRYSSLIWHSRARCTSAKRRLESSPHPRSRDLVTGRKAIPWMHHPAVPHAILERGDDDCDWVAVLGTFGRRYDWGDGTEANFPQYGILKVARLPATKRTLVPRSEIERILRESLVDHATPNPRAKNPHVKVPAEESGKDRMKRLSAQVRHRVAIQTRILRATGYFDDEGEAEDD